MDLITGALIYFVAFWIGAFISYCYNYAKSVGDKPFEEFFNAILVLHGISAIILFVMLIVKGVLR